MSSSRMKVEKILIYSSIINLISYSTQFIMKKILFALFAVAAFTFVGCEKKGLDIMNMDASKFDNTVEKCWKFTIKNAGIMDGVTYAWDTESNVITTLQIMYQASGNKAIVNYSETPADDKNACDSKNNWEE